MPERPGFYERRIFPWLNDRLAGNPFIERFRAETLDDACGRVVEIGFGTGLNLPHNPAGVERLVAVEPNGGMHARAAARIEETGFGVEMIPGVPRTHGRFTLGTAAK